MGYLIDGHNLIGVLPDIHLADPDDEARLLHRLRAFRAQAGAGPMIVFFDSGPGAGDTSSLIAGSGPGRQAAASGPAVTARFAEPGQTADDAIVAYLRGSTEPGQYAVVTDDLELTWRVQALGASVIRARDFAARLTERKPRSRGRAKRDGALPEGTPDPHAPVFADLYADFLSAEKARARFADAKTTDESAWIEKLYGDDASQAQLAARWLGQHGGKETLETLRVALTHPDARVRAAALLAFGDLGDPRALADLCDWLLHDDAGMARQAAAQSLGRIGNRSVESALETSAESDPKGKVRKAARDALAQVRARQPGLRRAGQGDAKPPS
jgi:predicted RNA-binding protein with PIN domain